MHDPTPEQAAALDAFGRREHVVMSAGAGCGKSTSLFMLACSTAARGIYLCYNGETAKHAKAKFRPTNCSPSTLHSLAFRSVMDERMQYRLKGGSVNRVKNKPQFARDVARILGIPTRVQITKDLALSDVQAARIVVDTIDRFARSADEIVSRQHMPWLDGMKDPETRAALAAAIGKHVRDAWKEMANRDGRLMFSHDVYRKVYALTHPVLDVDYVLVDEVQDSDALTTAFLLEQVAAKKQLVAVGDAQQAIYGWRGAENAMGDLPGRRVSLTQSFRFGEAIADEANRWLDLLDADLRLVGTPSITSTLAPLPGGAATAVLCRSNAEAVTQLIRAQQEGASAYLVGGGRKFLGLAKAAQELKDKGSTSSVEFAAFATWGQVQDYVQNDLGGEDLATAVKIVDTWGADAMVAALESMAPASEAALTISTAHQAKGLEFSRVRIAEDFPEPKKSEHGQPVLVAEELRLAYVAVTRAEHVLDRGSLTWVDDYRRAGLPLPV